MMRIAYHHHPCADGFTAAWALHRADPHVRFLPYRYPLKLTEEGLPRGSTAEAIETPPVVRSR